MRYVAILVVLALCLSACKRKRTVKERYFQRCETPEDRQALSEFVLDCIDKAKISQNRYAEDVVEQCERTGRDVVCPPVCVKEVWNNGNYQETSCDEGPSSPRSR